MGLNERIQYWRARAALAKRFRLAREAELAEQIVAELRGLARNQARVDARIDRLAEQVPQELYEVE